MARVMRQIVRAASVHAWGRARACKIEHPINELERSNTYAGAVVGLFALMVLDLEVVSLTLKLPEVWGNTSKAGMVLDDLEVASERLWVAKLEVVLWVAKLEVVSLTGLSIN